MLGAVHAMSESAQGVFYLIALVLFLVAAVFGYMTKAVWAALVATGLAFMVAVLMVNAFAAA